MLFYKILFEKRENITGSMALLYSTLVGRSIMSCGELYDFDGTFLYDEVHNVIKDLTNNGEYYIDCDFPKKSHIAKEMGMSLKNVTLTLNRLDRENYISLGFNSIYCPLNLLDEGFLKIRNDTNLKGWQLIDYTFLKNRSLSYDGTIDSWASTLAPMLHTTENNVYKTIERLKEKGYVKRLADGRLLVK